MAALLAFAEFVVFVSIIIEDVCVKFARRRERIGCAVKDAVPDYAFHTSILNVIGSHRVSA